MFGMGQGPSCAGASHHHDFFAAVQGGDLGAVESSLTSNPYIVSRTTIYDRLSALHIAAANGRVEVRHALSLTTSWSRPFPWLPLIVIV